MEATAIAVEPFAWVDFWAGLAETAIGAFLGFVFALLAFHHQRRRERLAQERQIKETAFDALNRLVQASGMNFEALLNTKRQITNDLRPEVAAMTKVVADFDAAPRDQRRDIVMTMGGLSESFTNFYKVLPELVIMPAPDLREMTALSEEMPALNTFVHRAMSTMYELNARIKERNELIGRHADEMTRDGGMRAERFGYYCAMLSGEGEYICDAVDFDLEFFKLVIDQINEYAGAYTTEGRFLTFELAKDAKDAMPVEKFAELRNQLVSFPYRGH